MESQVNNLNSSINTIRVLNINKEESTISEEDLLSDADADLNHEYILSDADEQILILIQFEHVVHLTSIKIYACPIPSNNDISVPKKIHIFVTKDLNIDFDDFDPNKVKQADKSTKGKTEKLEKGQKINLKKNNKFFKVKYLAIFVETNQNNTECTCINRICFEGIVDRKNINAECDSPKMECAQCPKHYNKPIINPRHENQIILPLSHNKQNTNNKNTHLFTWKIESHIQRFNEAKHNEVTFRSDYHLIQGNLIYFEITPNGWGDKSNIIKGYCPIGNTNIWFALHQSNAKTANVEFRFQCVCKDVSYIGEKDQRLINWRHNPNCVEPQSGLWAFAPDNSMKLSKFKHLKSITFLLIITVNPTTFGKSLDDQIVHDNYKIMEKAHKKDNKEVLCDKRVVDCPSIRLLVNVLNHMAAQNESYDCDTIDNDAFKNILQGNNNISSKPIIRINSSKNDKSIQPSQINLDHNINNNKSQQNKPKQNENSNNPNESNDSNKSNNSINSNNNNMQNIIDLFIHSLAIHGSDEEYDYIMKTVSTCDIEHCDKFERHSRDRNVQYNIDRDEKSDIDTHDSVNRDIMDKIHCYYKHSTDIGHKLTETQRQELSNFITEQKKDEPDSYSFENKALTKLRQFLSTKNKYNIRGKNRYSKFVIIQSDAPYQVDSKNEEKVDSKNEEKAVDFYSYGQKFYYKQDAVGYKNVLPHFQDLKEEMLFNSMSVMSSQQFLNEMQKAKLYMHSYYCKQYYPNISTRQILALIIYCAYTQLQYQFSKTFRDNTQEHNQFYYFGYLLSSVINDFGKGVKSGDVFYHGIDNEYLFSCVTGPKLGIQINSPLSTTTEFAVATRFSANGLIVEFGSARFGISDGQTRYFSVALLSDYADEKECLFVHNKYGLRMMNITSVKTKVEQRLIIHALEIIEGVVMPGGNVSFGQDDRMQNIVQAILKHKLSQTYPQKYKALHSLDKYSEELIENDLQYKKVVDIDYANAREQNLSEYFCNIYFINAIFGSVENIILRSVTNNGMTDILNDALEFWEKKESIMETVAIYPSQATMDDIIQNHQNRFVQLGHSILSYDKNQGLILLQTTDTKVPKPPCRSWNNMLIEEFNNIQLNPIHSPNYVDEITENTTTISSNQTSISSYKTSTKSSDSTHTTLTVPYVRDSITALVGHELQCISENKEDNLNIPVIHWDQNDEIVANKHYETKMDENIFTKKFAHWLCYDVKLGQYLSNFVSKQWNDIEMIDDFNYGTLVTVGIKNEYHRRLILKEVRKFQSGYNNFQQLIEKHQTLLKPLEKCFQAYGIWTIDELQRIKSKSQLLVIIKSSDVLNAVWNIIQLLPPINQIQHNRETSNLSKSETLGRFSSALSSAQNTRNENNDTESAFYFEREESDTQTPEFANVLNEQYINQEEIINSICESKSYTKSEKYTEYIISDPFPSVRQTVDRLQNSRYETLNLSKSETLVRFSSALSSTPNTSDQNSDTDTVTHEFANVRKKKDIENEEIINTPSDTNIPEKFINLLRNNAKKQPISKHGNQLVESKYFDNTIIVFGNNNDNTKQEYNNNQNQSKNNDKSNNDNSDNDNNKPNDNNDNNDNVNRDNSDDDDKNNDKESKNTKSNGKNNTKQDDQKEVDRFFDILSDIKNIDDEKLHDLLSTFSPTVFTKVSDGIRELNDSLKRVSQVRWDIKFPEIKTMEHQSTNVELSSEINSNDNGYSSKSESSNDNALQTRLNRNRALVCGFVRHNTRYFDVDLVDIIFHFHRTMKSKRKRFRHRHIKNKQTNKTKCEYERKIEPKEVIKNYIVNQNWYHPKTIQKAEIIGKSKENGRITLSLEMSEFMKRCKQFITNSKQIILLPFNDKNGNNTYTNLNLKHYEYLCIVNVDIKNKIDIGISFKCGYMYDSFKKSHQYRVTISGIHMCLSAYHQKLLCGQYDLSRFGIDYLNIYAQTHEYYKYRYEKLFRFIRRFKKVKEQEFVFNEWKRGMDELWKDFIGTC